MSSCRPEGQGLFSLYICSPKCVPLQKGQLPVSVRSVDVLRPGPSAASARSGASSKAMATRAWGRGTSSVVTSAAFLLPEYLTPVEGRPTPFPLPTSLPVTCRRHLPSQKRPFISRSRKAAHLSIKSCLQPTPLKMCWGDVNKRLAGGSPEKFCS